MTDSTNNYASGRKIIVLDTTLRDGDQSAYGTMYPSEKMKIALQLEKMGVDRIEAGFAASHGNFEFMEKVARTLKKPVLSGLSRCVRSDTEKTYEAYRNYEKRMIHLFLPTSAVQVSAKMKKNEDELIKIARDSVAHAKRFFNMIEFTAEDAVRTNWDFLKKIYFEAINCGATIINVADTVGYSYPSQFGMLVKNVTDYVKSIDTRVQISVHCHNDLGLASANTIAGIENGAEQVEVTINGLGERAGNCSLEQIIAFSWLHPNIFSTNVQAKEIARASEMVSEFTGIKNDSAPIVGKSAFSHKAGIHQQGVINNKESYEVLNAEKFGRKTEIIIGPHSGHHGVIAKAKELGFDINPEQAMQVLEIVSEKVQKETQKRFSDSDIRAIIEANLFSL